MSSFITRTLPEQLMLSYHVGSVGGHTLQPSVQFLVNDAWKLAAVRPPDPYYLAKGVAQRRVDTGAAYEWAKEQGFDAFQMDAMVNIANVGPAFEVALRAWRRGYLTDAQFQVALDRQGIEQEWYPMLRALKAERLDLGALATAVHRGIMADNGLLVTPVPQGSGVVPRIPQSPLDTLKEFAAHGIDAERARVLVADTGLPLALGEMLQLLNRGEVTETDVQVAIAESNIRNEYMDVALKLRRRILTPHEYAESELRGIHTHAEAQAGAALSGLTADDYATVFGNLGRPLNAHEITTGLARGGSYGGTYDDVPAGPYRDAIRRSAIRPEYAGLAYANRYTYPSPFVLRSLAQAGTLGTEPEVVQTLEEIGWKPSFAAKVAADWMGGGSGGDKHVTSAQTRLITQTHKSYIDYEISDSTATATLEVAAVAAASVPAILTLWQAERDLIRKSLTAAQIRKAYRDGDKNPATGLPWDIAAATARLAELGYSPADITTLLEL